MDSGVLDLFTRRVAAAPTKVAATATETAVSGSEEETVTDLLCKCDFPSFTSNQDIKSEQKIQIYFSFYNINSKVAISFYVIFCLVSI